MNNYSLHVQTKAGGVRWEHPFEANSDNEALQYAGEHTKMFAGVDWFQSMLLVADDRTPRKRIIGRLMLLPQQVRVIAARPIDMIGD